MQPPRVILFVIAALIALTLLPLAVIAVARTSTSSRPRIHPVLDMDAQEFFGAQEGTTLFSDGRAMRPPPEGTIAYGRLGEDTHYLEGRTGETFATAYPKQITVDEGFLKRGRDMFNVFCAPCHGRAGYGDGLVSARADALAEGTWTPPSDLHAETVRARPVGELFHYITAGVRNMPAYDSQIRVPDRWAIVAYVKALQLSQGAQASSLPVEFQQGLQQSSR
jgi:mono/diheme cytochrome c family protein